MEVVMEMESGDGGSAKKVIALIEKATNSTDPEIDPRLLKAIKFVVRSSDAELRLSVETLMDQMKRDHSQVRYLALLIIDELFMRSKLFRSLLTARFEQFLTLSVGYRRNLPLPAPLAIASRLRSKAIEFLEKWNASFGIHYRQLRLGFDYLKNTLRYQFPNLQQNANRIQQERREREMRSKEILLNKFEMLKENVSSIKAEIQSTIDEIGECLEILRPKEDSFVLGDPADDDEVEAFSSSALQQIRQESLKEGEKVSESSDNKVIFDTVRELYKLLVTRHLVTVQEWLSVLIRVEPADIRFRDLMLKEFIDLRNHVQSVKKRCEESGCVLIDSTNDMDENMWEEGKIETFDPGASSSSTKISEHFGNYTASKRDKSVTSTLDPNDSDDLRGGDGSDSDPARRKLLSEAPVMAWGSFLDSWGSSRDVPANQRGLELEAHWGRVDYDAMIPAEKIAKLNVHAVPYKEDRGEIQPCSAPLRKGGLCQRRDLRVCPFHGPIVPRDSKGNPIDQAPENNDKKIELEGDVLEQLAKEAVKNVRDRDKEDAKKKEIDKQMLKRAKLAKVREHNEAVLREAAMASTSHSEIVGNALELGGKGASQYKEKKPTLASMLRKKVTTKDRLMQRLLNTQARDATTRQLTMGEDANYREAFPNQW
ncbi:hypothetical protein Syun_019587 [Stephania yunnanensis]|uniref:UV-stimulated scaffold protein A C-terminal domain-containing protein n=1 Tax=Stephania yunnanensis TaxID=152371 RepID=A0AAP0IV44_9MAGN